MSPEARHLPCLRLSPLALALGLCLLPGMAAAEDDDIEALLDILSEETELATRSKQNADYVPGMVSVLHASDMRLIGARTALDALALVPGLDIQRNQFGAATIRVRSVDFFFNAGNIKVLVDGLPSSREAAFQSSAVLLMPIEQIERIEVIRGPGSGVHGDFAYMGLINIVTRHHDNVVGLNRGSGNRNNAYAAFSTRNEERDFALSGNLSDWRSDRYDVANALDNDEQRSILNLRLGLHDWSFKLTGIDRDFSGQVRNTSRPGQPPPPVPFRTNVQIERGYTADVRREWSGEDENRAAAWVQYQDSEYDRRFAGFEGSRTEIGGDIVRKWGSNLLLGQVTVTDLDIDRAYSPAEGPPGTPPPPEVRHSRQMYSAVLQNQFNPLDNVQITAGLRWDDLEGVDSQLTPRIAALWQIDDHHLLKAQYAEGFRSPTYQEGFSNGEPRGHIPFERVQSSEISYVYRGSKTVFRATGFNNKVTDMIFPEGVGIAALNPEIDAQGLEFELNIQFNAWLKSMATYSTANAFDGRSAISGGPGQPPLGFGAASIGQPEQLGNLAFIVDNGGAWSGGLHWQHVGRRADRGVAGFQEGYNAVNLGLTYRPPGVPQLRVDVGARNLFEGDINYLETGTAGGLIFSGYRDRLWSVGVSWDFGTTE